MRQRSEVRMGINLKNQIGILEQESQMQDYLRIASHLELFCIQCLLLYI